MTVTRTDPATVMTELLVYQRDHLGVRDFDTAWRTAWVEIRRTIPGSSRWLEAMADTSQRWCEAYYGERHRISLDGDMCVRDESGERTMAVVA